MGEQERVGFCRAGYCRHTSLSVPGCWLHLPTHPRILSHLQSVPERCFILPLTPGYCHTSNQSQSAASSYHSPQDTVTPPISPRALLHLTTHPRILSHLQSVPEHCFIFPLTLGYCHTSLSIPEFVTSLHSP